MHAIVLSIREEVEIKTEVTQEEVAEEEEEEEYSNALNTEEKVVVRFLALCKHTLDLNAPLSTLREGDPETGRQEHMPIYASALNKRHRPASYIE